MLSLAVILQFTPAHQLPLGGEVEFGQAREAGFRRFDGGWNVMRGTRLLLEGSFSHSLPPRKRSIYPIRYVMRWIYTRKHNHAQGPNSVREAFFSASVTLMSSSLCDTLLGVK